MDDVTIAQPLGTRHLIVRDGAACHHHHRARRGSIQRIAFIGACLLRNPRWGGEGGLAGGDCCPRERIFQKALIKKNVNMYMSRGKEARVTRERMVCLKAGSWVGTEVILKSTVPECLSQRERNSPARKVRKGEYGSIPRFYSEGKGCGLEKI